LWAVCWCTYICIPGDIVSSLVMYIYLYTWWHCEQFVDVHKLLTMSPGIQIYVHQQTAHNVTRYTDICTSINCSQCHQVYRYMYINKLLTMSPGILYLVTLWAVCWCTYICIPGDIVSSLLMYIYLYTWWHCEQFVDVHISVYLVRQRTSNPTPPNVQILKN
jgi:putative effector of murein hydrolase LrgA (UPF0299 family)